uniref:Uncharacterized protein n=1 Tax=Anopheles minimus TaxID=112268 RepID=A0A182W806_9DIPT
MLNESKYKLRIRAIIADSPARAFIKGVVSFNATSGCLKCEAVATHDSVTNRMYFDGINALKRTDIKFRNMEYPSHIKNPTPLIDLINFDIIQDVIVSDRLHLIDLGLMKKLLNGWCRGLFGYRTKWSIKEINEISMFLENMQLPSEIHRQLRSLKYLHYWKGTELRTFLHYASIVILKDRIPDYMYKHFMLFFCAITLLSSYAYEQHWELAGQMLDTFVNEFGDIYDKSIVSSNVHNIQHVYDEVCRFGPLEEISSYPFENHLQRIKRLLRSGSRSLEQVVNRLTERRLCKQAKEKNHNKRYPILITKGHDIEIHLKPDFMLKKGGEK